MAKNFSYQLVSALKTLHEAKVIHRDLKPQNVLISCTDNNYVLKLCDFGTGRAETTKKIQDLRRTTLVDVTTAYYLAPEGILSKECYSNSVDVWALGCIIAELIKRSPLFYGSSKDQLRLIVGICGKPTQDDLARFPDSPEKNYLQSAAEVVTFSLEDSLPGVDSSLLEFIRQFLVFHPEKRITAANAVMHPFLTSISQPKEVTIRPYTSTVELEKFTDEKWKELLWDELVLYKNNNITNKA